MILQLIFFISSIQGAIQLPKRIRHDSTHPEKIMELCGRGQVQVLQAILEDNPEIRSNSHLVEGCFMEATKHQRASMLTFLMDEFQIRRELLQEAMKHALQSRSLVMANILARDGQLFYSCESYHILKYAYTGILWDFLAKKLETFEIAAPLVAGKIGFLGWIEEHWEEEFAHSPGSAGLLLDSAISEGHLHIFEWFFKNQFDSLQAILEDSWVTDRVFGQLVRILTTIEHDRLEFFKDALYDYRNDWAKFIRSGLAASLIQVCITYGAQDILSFLLESLHLLDVIRAEGDEEVISLLYLTCSICNGILQLQADKRSQALKIVLQAPLPSSVSITFLLCEALPTVLGQSTLGTLSQFLDVFGDQERLELFSKLAIIPERRSKVEVLYRLTVACSKADLKTFFAFMDAHPTLTKLIEEIWDTILFKSDGFIEFTQQLLTQ